MYYVVNQQSYNRIDHYACTWAALVLLVSEPTLHCGQGCVQSWAAFAQPKTCTAKRNDHRTS